jgi:hypothetical protein
MLCFSHGNWHQKSTFKLFFWQQVNKMREGHGYLPIDAVGRGAVRQNESGSTHRGSPMARDGIRGKI